MSVKILGPDNLWYYERADGSFTNEQGQSLETAERRERSFTCSVGLLILLIFIWLFYLVADKLL